MKELLAALDLETIPQVSLGTAALLIFGACAVLAVLRGLLRIFAGSLVVFLSGFAAYLTWRHAPTIEIPGGPWIAPVIALLGGFVVAIVIVRRRSALVDGDDSLLDDSSQEESRR